jgi:hypothetical protein
MSDSNLDISLRTQERFNAFFLGLIFTVLGLSIQTAKFGVGVLPDVCELLAWVSLLSSGLAGMSRAEQTPDLYRRFSLKDDQEAKRRAGQTVQLQGGRDLHVVPLGKTVPVAEYIADAERGAEMVEATIAPLKKKLSWRYKIMRYGFVSGLALLILSRGLPAVFGIVEALR